MRRDEDLLLEILVVLADVLLLRLESAQLLLAQPEPLDALLVLPVAGQTTEKKVRYSKLN